MAARRQFGLKATVDVLQGNSVNARWVDIWAATVAVTTLCTAKGYAGKSRAPSGFSVIVDIASKDLGSGNETASA